MKVGEIWEIKKFIDGSYTSPVMIDSIKNDMVYFYGKLRNEKFEEGYVDFDINSMVPFQQERKKFLSRYQKMGN